MNLGSNRRLRETEETFGLPDKATQEKLRKIAKTVRKVLKVPFYSGGSCAIVCVGIWDQLGRPKDLIPYSVVRPDGDEHVVLLSKDRTWVFDPTSDQYDLPDFMTDYDYKREFKSFQRLTLVSLQSIRQEGAAYLARRTQPATDTKSTLEKRRTYDWVDYLR